MNSPLQRLIPLHNKMNPIPAVNASMKWRIIEVCCSNSFCLFLRFFDRKVARFFWDLVSLEKSIMIKLVESIKMFLKRGEGFEPPNVRTATWRLTGLGHPRVSFKLWFSFKTLSEPDFQIKFIYFYCDFWEWQKRIIQWIIGIPFMVCFLLQLVGCPFEVAGQLKRLLVDYWCYGVWRNSSWVAIVDLRLYFFLRI